MGKSWILAATGGTTSRENERTQAQTATPKTAPNARGRHARAETRSRRDTLAFATDTLAHTDTLALLASRLHK